MPIEKVILLVEAKVKPEYRATVVAAAQENLPLTLAEPGVEAFYQTVRDDDPNRLVFFEVFRSKDAHDLHMEEEYTKKVFRTLEGRLSAPPVITKLVAL